MATSEQGFIERLIGEEIRRMVADAIKQGTVISTSECASQISRAYGRHTLSERDIADEVIMAAASAGVAVEIGQRSPLLAPVAGADNG